MKIRDVYRPAVQTCAGSDTLHDAARQMEEADTGVLVVFDGDELSGVLTERDLVRAVAVDPHPGDAPVRAHATRSVITADLDEDVEAAARKMLAGGVRRLPVLGPGGLLVGIVSMRDLFALEVLAAAPPEGGSDA